jgi:hypothetical protein
VVLGVLNILGGQDIATILAAIAGYVLGNAGSISEKRDGKTEESKTTK